MSATCRRPFGGVKNSGIGRDGGDWSFDFYMETKNIAFATGPHGPSRSLAADHLGLKMGPDQRWPAGAGGRRTQSWHAPKAQSLSALQHRASEPCRVRRHRSRPLARLLCRYARPAGDRTRRQTRSICAPWRNAVTIASCCARPTRPRRAISASRSMTRPIWTRRRSSSRPRARRRMGRAAVSGPHVPHPRSAWHAARILFDSDGEAPAADPPEICALSRREAAAHRPFQLLLARMSTKALAFYNEIGFRVTEYTAEEDTGRLWAAWMHRKGGVHDIAFTNGRGPRLHHTAFWVPTPLNIIDLLDVMASSGYLEEHRARPRPSRHFERLLPLHSRSGRSPHRDLLLGLSDSRSGS